MTGLVLFSHGSLLCGAGGALETHAARLRAEHGFRLVEVGYLNYNEPSFADAVARIANAGANRIVIVPFFLAPGYFVNHSLPKCVDSVRPAFPGLEFVIAPPLGADERLADAVLESAGASRGCEHWRAGLDEALSACRLNSECPLYGGCVGTHPVASNSVLVATPSDTGGVAQAKRSAGVGLASLLVMVHGSPKPDANDEMFRVVESVRKRKVYPIVEVGFMECNEPSIPQAIKACVVQGADRIDAVPYFLHMGTHVADDLPALLAAEASKWTSVHFRMGEYIGRSDKLTDLLAARANEALGA